MQHFFIALKYLQITVSIQIQNADFMTTDQNSGKQRNFTEIISYNMVKRISIRNISSKVKTSFGAAMKLKSLVIQY
jgi:hypothetical protein